MASNGSLTDLFDTHWVSVRFTLRNTSDTRGSQAHYLSVIDAILREPNNRLGITSVFRVNNRNLKQRRIAPQDHLTVTAVLPSQTEATAQRWVEALVQHLGRPRTNHEVVDDSLSLTTRSLSLLQQSLPSELQELLLDFETPFAFKPHRPIEGAGKRENWKIDSHELLKRLAARVKKLFGIMLDLSHEAQAVNVFPEWWQYTVLKHRSVSNPGTTKWLKGCIGPLYVGGEVAPLLPLFQLCSEVNAGADLAFGQGAFELSYNPQSSLCLFADSEREIESRIEQRINADRSAHLSLAAEFGQPLDVAQVACSVSRSLREGTYSPQPANAFSVPKKSGESRVVESLSPLDDAVHHVLAKQLEPVAERLLEPQAFAFRHAKSRKLVKDIIDTSIRDGYTHALITDIDNLFPSIDHDNLIEILKDYLPQAERCFIKLLVTSIRIPRSFSGVTTNRERGLCQGSALSPVLANLYLDRLDEALQAHELKFVRFADDFAILARHEDALDKAQETLDKQLDKLGLALKAVKSWRGLANEGFEFVGYHFGGGREAVSAPALHKKQVYITEAGYFLGNRGDALHISHRDHPAELIPFRRIGGIHVLGRISLSSSMLNKCKRMGVPVTIVDSKKSEVVSWMPERAQYFDVSFRQRQGYEALTDTARLAIASDIVTAKVDNGVAMLRQRQAAGFAAWEQEVRFLLQSVQDATTQSALLGHEGHLAKLYFHQWSQSWDSDFFIYNGRRRGKTDAVNSMLNLGYSLLFARINTTVRCLGLNPYLGWLHMNDNRYETLVVDMQEPFRSHIDRMVARMIGLKIIRQEHFVKTDDGMRFNNKGMRLFIGEFERMMNRSPKSSGLTLADAIHAQALNVKNYFLEQSQLHWYRVAE